MDDLIGVLDRLAEQENEVDLTDAIQGLQIVVEAFWYGGRADLAGDFPGRLPAHAVGDQQERSEIAHDVAPDGGLQSALSIGEVADGEIVLVVLAHLARMGQTEDLYPYCRGVPAKLST